MRAFRSSSCASSWNAAGCRRDGRQCSPRTATGANSPANTLLARFFAGKNSLPAAYAKQLLVCDKYLMGKSLSAVSPVDFELGLDVLREFSLTAGKSDAFRAPAGAPPFRGTGRRILDSPSAVPIVRASRTGHPVRRGRAPWHPARGKPYRRVSCSL